MSTLVVGLSLLLNVHLGATLLRLALIVQLLVALLAFLVSHSTREGTANRALGTVAQAVTVVAQLALSFLLLTLEVLFTPGLLQGLQQKPMLDHCL